MIFPSLKNLRQSVTSILKRFSFEMLFALIGTIVAIVYLEFDSLGYLTTKIRKYLLHWYLSLLITTFMHRQHFHLKFSLH